MDSFSIKIQPQYVRLTNEKEFIKNEERYLHKVQYALKCEFETLPRITLISAPTGTGKSYAFPFPALKSGDAFGEGRIRGLIVLPTNALINELTASFKEDYEKKGLRIASLTAETLNERHKKGYKRWQAAIDIAKENDLVITNPDIINYAMHGGYHSLNPNYKSGADNFFSAFIAEFGYIIYDEYHLYDEAQVANLLTLIEFDKILRGGELPKFFFVSATPEVGLKKLLIERGYEEEKDFKEIIEEIVVESPHARVIHGLLDVEFHKAPDIDDLIIKKYDEIEMFLNKGEKVLLILDEVRKIQEWGKILEKKYKEKGKIVYESTGYVSKTEDHNKKIKEANIIIASNKSEVGVNYEVNYCIMQTGKYYQNFVQRFGRVARGEQNGKIVIGLKEYYNELKQPFKKVETINYYQFLDKIRPVLQSKKFYTDFVPLMLGEYWWCIQNNWRIYQEPKNFQYLSRKLEESGWLKVPKIIARYLLMKNIDDLIWNKMCQALGFGISKSKYKKPEIQKLIKSLEYRSNETFNWLQWWERYLATYYTFRDGGKTVLIYDKSRNEELEYSLDWILQHKYILKEETLQTEPYEIIKYTVGDLKERTKELTYTVSTIPDVKGMENNFLDYSQFHNDLREIFKVRIGNLIDKNKRTFDANDSSDIFHADLLPKVQQLSATFSRKRLKIENVESSEQFL